MGFNKKRACCCGTPTPGVDTFYFELFTKIPIAAVERSQSGTYSYWIKIFSVDNVDGVPVGSTVIYEDRGDDNYASEVPFDVTLAIWQSLEDGLVFIPQPRMELYATDGSSSNFFSNAFRYRGLHMSSDSRLLEEDDWEDLDEIKIRMFLPGVNEAVGNNKFNTVRNHGYFFNNGQYDQEPAIGPITVGELQYSMFPKVAANHPRRYSAGGVEYFDFSALFPNSLSFDIQGSFPIRYRKSELPQEFNAPPEEDTIPVDFTFTFSKEDQTTVDQTTIVYMPDQSGAQEIGDKTIEWSYVFPGTDPPVVVGPMIVRLVAELDVGGFRLTPFGGLSGNSGEIASCITDIGYKPDANGYDCKGCDISQPQPQQFGSGCFGANYAGSVLANNRAFHLMTSGQGDVDGTASVDLTDGDNYPNGGGIGPGNLRGIAAAPAICWGAATGEAVELEILAPAGLGFPSLRVLGGQGTCHKYNESPSHYVFTNEENDGSVRTVGIVQGNSESIFTGSIGSGAGTLIQTD